MYAWYNALLCGIYATLLIVAILFGLSLFFRNGRCAYILSNMKLCYFPFLISLIVLFAFIIMINTFNNGKLFIGTHTEIPVDISKWGDFATFFGGIFTLITIYLAYRAFISQVNASRRTSFDATFTQIFAQHKILYDKAVNHKIYIGFWNKYICNITNRSQNVFSACREEYEIRQMSMSVEDFWKHFNDKIELEASIDFKNYFKYIYHEVNLVIQEDCIDDEMKKRYIGIIQSQMNNDELLCYMINQMDYYLKDKTHEKNNEYIKHLKNYGFFKEICKRNSGYLESVLRVIGKNNIEEITNNEVLVKKEWFYYKH